MEFISALGTLAFQGYQLENTISSNRRQAVADNAFRAQQSKQQSRNIMLMVGGAVVLGLIYIKTK